MVSATSNIGSLSFDTFVADYLDDVRYELIDGIYQGKQFGRTERPISQTFPDLNLTAEQIFAAGRSS
ncbi:hypothetical protein VF14_30675 [Nostoc linckia z18]|uniref:Uncharacterized protein n=2 Tax=Nostoc linckia TaxID=92942 RepID=A0A9Q5ZAU5_NOSLI|nr:hypothetical protein VF05_30855 [Nostoc linckia z3]PHJ77062.1 hypothetical protein VF03_06235 [Nostoc linckia z2]PHJ81525.1 hypothetical protein VF07_30285 [Nostoc linckia z6]PHJ89594.1 hypothetical protein VF04_32010 [Nostoc linckia z7]PHK02387.1 hypothetical protein VF08_18780 [Nostoc linckia z8]PHK10594.1 hypothetical protein VF09_10205 [Nostoc linckia z9]PHK29579.1 hypothetical protein VF14_30675 [Nostoc linckia z18]PHK47819.1 hypothetical protein VF13_03080 [Nostoc linckia z16]